MGMHSVRQTALFALMLCGLLGFGVLPAPVRAAIKPSQIKNALEEKGLALEALYTGDVYRAPDYSSQRRKTRYLDVFDLIVDIDLARLINWPGANFYTDIIVAHGQDPSGCVGDYQGISNIAAENNWRIYEFWFQQNFWQDRFAILTGIYDINSEFDVLEPAAIFLNGSFGMGPDFAQSGGNGAPAYPCTDLGLRIKIRPTADVYIQAALFDGFAGEQAHPHRTPLRIELDQGALFASEISLLKGAESIMQVPIPSRRGRQRRHHLRSAPPGPGRRHYQRPGHYRRTHALINRPQQDYLKVALGGWYHSGSFADLYRCDQNNLPRQHKGSWGCYLLAGKTLFSRPGRPRAGLSAFARIGLANPQVNLIDRYVGGGLIWSECTGSRHYDQLGLAVAAARKGAPDQSGPWETVLELTYRMQINAWLTWQPDLQYIINPGFNGHHDPALAIGMRLGVAL